MPNQRTFITSTANKQADKNHSITIIATALMLLILCSLAFNQAFAADKNASKILMVVTSYGLEKGNKQPGYEFDEFSKAYLVFKANGIAVDVASPKGGPVEADKYNPDKPYNQQVLADQSIMAKLNNTLATSSLKATDYTAVFVVGGKGAMFDLPKDKALQQLIATIYQDKGSIAAVCHGPAALVDVKLADGSYLVAGKAINSFTNVEEQAFGQKWLPHFDFMLEDKLTARGGKFEKSPMMLSHVTSDKRLITGQNPSSTSETAEALVRSLGFTPVARKPFLDEATLAIIARVLDNDSTAVTQLIEHSEDYQLPMVGMYGFYQAKLAQNEAQMHHAVTLIKIAQKALNNPALDMQLIKTQLKLGQKADAKSQLQALLGRHPDKAEAIALLEKL